MTNTKKPKASSGGGFFDALLENKRAKMEQQFKVQEANMKMKGELMKAILPKLIEQKMAQSSPQQQHLRSLVARENPIMATMGDQTGAPQGGGQVTFDPSINEAMPTMNEKGLYEQKPQGMQETEDKKAQAFLSMSDAMINSGKQLPAWMMKARENAQNRMNKRLGYSSSEESPTILNQRIDYLENQAESSPENDALINETKYQLGKALKAIPKRPDRPNQSIQGAEISADQQTQDSTQSWNDMENLIQENMDYYKKSREEIVSAFRKKGIIK